MQVYPTCLQVEDHILNFDTDPALKQKVGEIFRDRWEKMHSPLHAAAFVLEPEFMMTEFEQEVR